MEVLLFSNSPARFMTKQFDSNNDLQISLKDIGVDQNQSIGSSQDQSSSPQSGNLWSIGEEKFKPCFKGCSSSHSP
ncbi:unnamed protein product, partial [Arabidopsis halleri]